MHQSVVLFGHVWACSNVFKPLFFLSHPKNPAILPSNMDRRLQQQRCNPGQFKQKIIKWICKPKIHYFDHQLLLVRKRRANTRHTHCFTDEDSMRWLKTISRKTTSVHFEKMVLSASRLRLKLAVRKAGLLNRSAALRSKR